MFNFPKIKSLNTLIIINVVAYFAFMILSGFVSYISDTNIMSDIFYLKGDFLMTLFTPWTLITYSFLHGGFMHLFSNIIGLFFIGMIFAQIFGEKKLLSFYLSTALFVGIFNVIIYSLSTPSDVPYIYAMGASGVVFGLLTAVGLMAPDMKLNLILFTAKLKWVVLVYLLLEISMLTGSSIGHLSGAVFGLLFAYYWKKGFNLTSFTERLIYKKRLDPGYQVLESGYGGGYDDCPSCVPTKTWTSKKNKVKVSLNVNDILDKISDKGMKSLTNEELKYLKSKK